MDAALRRRLIAAGIVDVEGILEVSSAKLVEIVGDRAAAAKLAESAKRLLDSPNPRRQKKPARKKAVARARAKKAKKPK